MNSKEYLFHTKDMTFQHREIMEIKLKRKLTSDEIVHHINGDPSDNRVRNLKVMTHMQHHELHAEQAFYSKEGK